MNAAERNFPSPPSSPAWIDLAKNVFDAQAARWDQSLCGGGLRWQIFTFSKGYSYKNAASQATFFLLAARLARYTNNATYVDWASKAYDWTSKVGLITNDSKVFDGVQTASGCSEISRLEWSYNAAAFMYGSAVIYNHVRSPVPAQVTLPQADLAIDEWQPAMAVANKIPSGCNVRLLSPKPSGHNG